MIIIIIVINYWALTVSSSTVYFSSPRNRDFIPIIFFDKGVRVRELHSVSPQISMTVMSLVTVLGTKNIWVNKWTYDHLNIGPDLTKCMVQKPVTKSICFCRAGIMIPP